MATPTTTIDALPAAASVTGAQLVIIQEAGVTKKASVDNLATYLEDHLSIPLTAAEISALSNPNVLGTNVQSQLSDLIARLTQVEETGGGSGAGGVWLRWNGTQAEYDALGAYRTDTIYAITGTGGGNPTGPLSAPLNVTALAGDASVTITWAVPATGTPTSYSIERSTVSSGGFVQIGTTTAAVRTFLNAPLTNDTTYYYTVTAHDASNAAASAVVSVMPHGTAPTVPGVPTNVAAIAGPSTVTINWLAPVSNGNSPITGYTVQRSTSASTGFTTVQTVSATTFSHLSSGLTNGTTYYFRVYATNAVGDSALSTTVNAVPTTGATVPSIPLNVVATPGPGEVTVTWDASASTGGSTINAYIVERSTLPSSGFVVVGTLAAGTHTLVSNPLTAGTTYYFRVLAQNSIGNSAATSPVSAVPTAIGTVPSDWATAVATHDLAIITGWYDTYTGHLSDGWNPAGLWGPGRTSGVTIDDTWLAANAAPGKVVLSGGRWTITGLHCEGVQVRKTNVTLSHCFFDRDPTTSGWGVDASPSGIGAFKGTIVDHCTLAGNFGTGSDSDFGDAIQYYNPADRAADGFVIRYCDISGYRAGLYTVFGTTCEYNWVHDLYIFAESHNTAGSIRGENTRIYRNLLTDGTSSAVSLYADETPYTNFEVNENIMATTNADYDINFPIRPPNNWHELYNPTTGAPLTSAYGYRRELNGNWFIPAGTGIASDASYFTSTRGNKLLDGTPVLFDEGGAAVATQPRLLKMRYNELGGGYLDRQQTWEFTPSPNSTLLVHIGCVNAGHSTTQTPTVTAVGQYPQVFSNLLSTPYSPPGDNYGVQNWLFKAETGATVSFEHIVVDPYVTTQGAWFTIWVYELTGMTGLSLAHSSVKSDAAVGFGATIDTITSNALSGAATTGRVCMAFAAGAAVAPPTPVGTYGVVSGWNRIGVQSKTFTSGSPFCTGAAYWRKDFTGTTITIPDLGIGTYAAGVILTEFS